MVKVVTGFGKSGLADWLWQRISAIIIAAYAIYLFYFVATNPSMSYEIWSQLFAQPFFKVATLFAIISVVMHSWIGIWTVFTDYVKCSCLRLVLQVAVILGLLAMLIWSVAILWGAS